MRLGTGRSGGGSLWSCLCTDGRTENGRLQSLKELRAGPRAGCPLCLLVNAPVPAIVPGFLARKEWAGARAPGFSG